jgi:hypothetical protein
MIVGSILRPHPSSRILLAVTGTNLDASMWLVRVSLPMRLDH